MDDIKKIYKCSECNLEYNSYFSMWRHKKNKHLINNNIKNNIEISNNICKYCEKELSDRKSRWRHENKTCKKNHELNINKQETIITNQFNMQHNSGTINNNNITINLNAPGKENVLELTDEEKEIILNDGLNSITTLIKYLNFNSNLPQNHTFCNTNLNNKYISALNIDTKEIEKHRKVDYFDKVLLYSMAHLKVLNNNISNKTKKKMFNAKIADIETYLYGKPEYKKIYVEQLNAISYNKRKNIQNTWNRILFNDILNC
jgi:hypothetical protein